MKFLLDQLQKVRKEPDGTEVYSDAAGSRLVQVNQNAGRALVRIDGREARLVLNTAGMWVPENNDWGKLAMVLQASYLATAVLGF